METQHTTKTITDSFILGLKGIFMQSHFLTKPFKSKITTCGAFVGVLISFIIINLKIDLYLYIVDIDNLIIQLVPGLLGFTIAGYSFLVGFIPSRLMERISEPQNEDGTSLFQSISSSLALNILLHVIILCIAYLIHLNLFIQDKSIDSRLTSPSAIRIFNVFGVFIVNIALFSALAIIIQIVASSFNLSQLYHYDVNNLKFRNKSSNNKN